MRVKVDDEPKAKVRVLPETNMPISSGIRHESVSLYTGEYEYTPSEVEQTVPIIGYKAAQNIKINPIPSNYGKVTWTGTVLTIE